MAPRESEIKQSKWLVNATITVLFQNMAPKGSEIKQSKWLVNATITVLFQNMAPRGSEIKQSKWLVNVRRGIVGTYLVKVHQVMLHTKYQDSRQNGFNKIFSCIFKTCDPGVGPFLAPGA